MKAVWNKEMREIKNHTLAYVYEWKAERGDSIQLAAASVYRLFVNGKLIGYGPARAVHGYSRVDHYDFSEYHDKQVRLVIEVFASNINTYYIVDELPFFSAELSRNGKIMAEASDFTAYHLTDRVTKVQKFSFQRSFVESYRMERCRSLFYKGDNSLFPVVDTEEVEGNHLLERRVNYPKLNTVWADGYIEQGTVVVDETLPKMRDRSLMNISDILKGYPYEDLTECLSDEVSGFCYRKGKSDSESVKGSEYRLYDFGRTLTGFFRVQANVKQSAVVYIIFDEVISAQADGTYVDPFRNTCCNVIKYRLEPGTYELLSFEPNSARYAAVVVAEGEADLSRFGMVLYENPDAGIFQFKTGDEELDNIIEAARNTFAQNAVDVLTDCPSRERAGWLCDSYFSSRAEALFTGKNLVEYNFLENYILSPQSPFLPSGMLPMCYPADHNDHVYIPNWTMWFVLELKNYLDRTGDRHLIEQAKKRVYDLIAFFSNYLNEDGLLENLESWVFIEWSKCNDPDYIKGVNYPSNMLYAAMLEAAGKMYDDSALMEQAGKMKKTIVDQSFNGSFFEDNRIRENGILVPTGHLTETCQYYAFYFGIAKPDEYKALYELLMTTFGPNRNADLVYPEVYPSNAIVGNYLRLELLLKDRQYEQVLQECKAFFSKVAELTGTLWEHSKLTASLNHGFASVAAAYIVECVKNQKQAYVE